MNKEEIKFFKKFLHERNAYNMFSENYWHNHLTINPQKMDEYLAIARAENVIPQAFIYPKSVYGKDFWLAIHEEWLERLSKKRLAIREKEQLGQLDLEIIDIGQRSSNQGLPKNTCSLSLRGGNRLTLNKEHSKMVAKKRSTHMLLTRSRQTKDVVLMFNRERGIDVKFRNGSNALLFNNAELAQNLIKLLGLDPQKEYFQIGIEPIAETDDHLLFILKKL